MRIHSALPAVLFVAASSAPLGAQVHYFPDGSPWNRRAHAGPDAAVDGWYLNLGITGLRVRLVEEAPKELVVKHVLDGSPAAGKVRVGDALVGAGGRPFRTGHRNGYGMEVFGADGPILEFAEALEASQGPRGDGRLELLVRRDGRRKRVSLKVGRRYGAFSDTFPADCGKSARILDELLEFLVEQQREDGSWGSPPHDTFAPLALLASGRKEHRAAAERNARYHARTTAAQDDSWLIHWRYMAAAIVLSEFHLATGAEWVVPELEEVIALLHANQYTSLAQVNPKVRETHPNSFPRDPADSHGGWGHNPGFEGYGPIAMLTAQGALAFALAHRCGVEIDRERHDAAYAFLERATGENGYVWYEDQVAGDDDWADMGRTGAAGIANFLAPYQGGAHRERALAHARVIGEHPESFPDTHGSPIMGMGYAALAAHLDPKSFRRLMDANRWWFALAQCPDGSFYYQPNRDNAGYGDDSRVSASAVTAFVLSIPKRNLAVTGRPLED
ncbi:MAG: DUF6288 domain-containing protein [Planctomycetota bacterium JB042]